MLTVLRQRKSAAALAASAAATALLLGGCAGGGSNTATSATTNDIAPTARDQVQDGGTLVWPISQSIPNFNLNQLDGSLQDNSLIEGGLLPSPFDVSADAKFTVNKDYFTDIKLTSQSPQVITYDINPNAKWDDGTAISYKDFQAQFNALNGKNAAYQVASTTGYDSIKTVERGTSDQQVVVTMAKTYADWQGLFSGLFPAKVNATPASFNTSLKESPGVTAGAFRFVNFDKTAQAYTVERNPKWWGDKAKLDKIVYRVIDPAAQTDALANGEVDLIDIGADKDSYARVQTLPGISVRRAAGPNFRHITFNGTTPILKDQAVRQAIARGIDREQIANALLGPLGGGPVLNNHIFMTNQSGYQDNSGVVKFDPEKAKQGLDAAGWTLASGQTFRSKAGKELTLNLLIPSGVPAPEQESKLIQQQLKNIGVNVKISTLGDDFFDNGVSPGKFDMTIFTWVGTPFPISSSESIYAKPKGADIQQNYARIGTKEIDDLFNQAASTLDSAEAVRLANEADKKIWEEVHSLTTYQRPDIWAGKSSLVNIGALGFATLKYQDIGYKAGSASSAAPSASPSSTP